MLESLGQTEKPRLRFKKQFTFKTVQFRKLFKYESIDETSYFPIFGKPDACTIFIRSSSTK
ncbi:hypothetical protein VCHA28O22_30406 [Vibrio chagasii]|nr:hypothetical protein VCHA28O22_30406 [Vibrio chagasii]CAH7186064.1 hypothetical protein VCHA50O393_20078 [Vibrio chagasii]